MIEKILPYEGKPGNKKSQIRQMFNRISGRYDALNQWLSLGIHHYWRRRAATALGSSGGGAVLDVATGTADLAIETARQKDQVIVLGVDLAESMLARGREKIAQRGLEERVSLQLADAENLPFPDNTFDGVTVAFGVRNFQQPEAGLREMNRVLKPGGRLVVLEFSKPQGFLFGRVFGLYFRFLLPLIGRWISRDPNAYTYLFTSVQRFPQGKAFEALLHETGFKNTACTSLTFGICSLYTACK